MYRFVETPHWGVFTLKILDIGTGSGCIAVALAKFLDNVDIIATDVSQEAINLAKENTKLLKVEEKIRFIKSDLFYHKFFIHPLNLVTD